MNDQDASRSLLTVVVPGDRPDVHAELLAELAGEAVRVVLDRRRATRSGRPTRGRRAASVLRARARASRAVSPSRTAIIVSPDRPERYAFVARHFADGAQVLYDRRCARRRVVNRSVERDRRRAERRRHDVDSDLRAVGWAVTQVGGEPAGEARREPASDPGGATEP
jgi:hypothetical protein